MPTGDALIVGQPNGADGLTQLLAQNTEDQTFNETVVLSVRPAPVNPGSVEFLRKTVDGIHGISNRGGTGVLGVAGDTVGQGPIGTGVIGVGGVSVGESKGGPGAFGAGGGSKSTDEGGVGVVGKGGERNGVGVVGVGVGEADGVVGICGADDTQASKSGVIGFNGAKGPGVAGFNTANTAGGAGVAGESTAGDGVVGACHADDKSGVVGFNSAGGPGVAGFNTGFGAGPGIVGDSTAGDGVVGTSRVRHKSGVIGRNLGEGPAVAGFCVSKGVAILGVAPSSASHPGAIVAGDGTLAGRFVGGVVVEGAEIIVGSLVVLGLKSAAVPHADGSHRLLYSVESPESWFEDFGEGKLVKGKATVRLAKDFAAVVKTKNYHVFLNAYGDSNGLYVTRRVAGGFEVREQNRGTASLTFSYRVVAKRKDVTATRLLKVKFPKTTRPKLESRLPRVQLPKIKARTFESISRIPSIPSKKKR
jgi:hypothetical protein